MKPRIIKFSTEEISLLRQSFEALEEVTSFKSNIELCSKIASYGIFREIGTVNDELARFIFDVKTAKPIGLKSLKAELVEWKGLFGLRIFSSDSDRLELRAKGFYELIHPSLSRNDDGTFHSLFIFPEIINKIAQSEGIELVLVKTWGSNSIFGGFDPSKGYYQTNFWEIENNDTIIFSDLIRKGKVAFMGTHDLIAHIAGVDKKHLPHLKQLADSVYNSIYSYFKSTSKPSISALIIPYTMGVVLDDLAQPPSYSSKSHIAILTELIRRISCNEIPANLPTVLIQFPKSFQKVIDLSRTLNAEKTPAQVKESVNSLVQEILNASVINFT
ncbi:MAG: hypothetical protein HUU56_15975 [Bdellovibrionaceae bacterium]|nr:hypothetical protein [Pseudobdellovibrionaceae bacterium]